MVRENVNQKRENKTIAQTAAILIPTPRNFENFGVGYGMVRGGKDSWIIKGQIKDRGQILMPEN